MKKRFLLLIGFFTITVLNLSAANRYWIGGTGNWTDLSHWTSTSGGIGGSSVPTSNDDVFFDQHSFSADQQTVTVASDVFCHSMDWSAINQEVAFSSTNANNISVSGSYILSPLLINDFRGQTNFTSTLSTNIIKTAGRTITGNWVFDGNASWLLGDDLTTESQVTISLKKGSLNSNSKKITCGSFIGTGIENRMLDLGQSIVTIENLWDFADDTNLNFSGSASQLIFNTPKLQNFKTASTLQYGTVSTSRSVLSHTVVITEIANNKCDSECNAILVATVSSGTGPYEYQWGTTPITIHPSALSTDTLYNVCEGSAINLFVEDQGSGEFASTSYTLQSFLVLQIAGFNKTKPSCFGYCDGSITPIVGGGTSPYDYLWQPSGQITTPATGLCAGNDTLILTDNNGCVATAYTTLTQPTLLEANGSSAMISCNANCNGTASVAPTGGTPGAGYTYLWSPNNETTPSISGLCPGSYTCTVTDSKNCVDTYIATITEPDILTLAVTQTNVSCGGLCDGTATATITGGTPPFTYVWTCGGTVTTTSLTNTVNGLCAGPCTVTVTDANLCTTNNSFTITQPPVLVATATGTNISCFGACDGTAIATVTGGTSTYSYVWSSGPPNPNTTSLTDTIFSLCALSYTVTVTDINNCTDTGVVALTQPIILDAIASKTDVLCFGACDGTATATPSGGTAPYTYFWKTVPVAQQNLQTISNLCPGTYTVIVTDFHLCKDSTTITISQPTQITTIATGTSVTCFGACDGTALGTPSGGTPNYTYAWTGPAIGVPAGNTDLIAGLCNGTYTLIVTDLTGCKDTSTVALTQPNPFTVSITNTPLLCNGDCNSTATTTVLGGTPTYTYAWTSSLGPNPPPLSTITSLCAGTYTVTVTDDNLCKAKDTVVITEPTLLVVNSTVINATCFNTNSGSACLSASGGIPTYTYAWLPGGEITSCINGQPAGTYSYTVTDVNNCKDTSSITITEPNVLQANPAVIRNLTCNNVIPCDGIAESTPTGGTPPFNYSWNTTPPQSVDSVTNLCTGTWSVTVTDDNGCISTQSIIITQPTPLSVNITNTTSSCDVCNGTATVTPTGGSGPYTYSWSPAPGGLAWQTATGLCSNVLYTVTITDANGCTATRTVNISQTVIISITTTNTVLSCFGSCDGIATANASGGSGMYDYLWGPGSPSGQGTGTITNLCAGTYWITVTDTSGCFNNDTIIFSNPPLLVASATSIDETCFGLCNATATASYVGGTGPVTYLWTGGGQTTQTATALCVGTYIVTVTDSMACNDTAQVVITQPAVVLDNYTIIDATCLVSNGSITVAPTGGSGAGYSYVWTGSTLPPYTGQGTASITNLAAGTYTLVITDGSGCSFTFNYFINNTNAPSVVMSGTPITCYGSCDGTATTVASGGAGGYLYNWTPGNPTGDGTPAITSLCSATYSIQVTDAIGCIAFDTISVLDPALVSPNPTIVNESCGGSCDGSITLNPSGGTGAYTYSWTNGLGAPMPATSSQINLCATLSPYSVTVTDANGCDSAIVITIISPPILTATIAHTDVNCFNACDGTAKVTPSGGTAPYFHSWSHGAIYITDSVLNLCPGTYTDTITDSKGCTFFVSATITQPTQLTTSSSQVNVSCYNLCDASASISTSGGTSPYSYFWNPMVTTNIAGDSAINLCLGTYVVTVKDAKLCQSILPAINITQPTQVVVNATSIDPTCNASCNGTATSTPSGGSGAGYTYLWNTLPVAQITPTATLLCAGTYNVTVTDGTGCSNNQNVTLIDPTVLSANASATPAICNNSCNGSVAANPVGGTAGYSYLWTPGLQITQMVLNECPNSYTVVVTDLNLCKDTQTVVVTNPLPLDVIVGSTPATCSFADGTMTITPITGLANYTYVWSPAPGMGDGTPNGSQMLAGIYSITVTDANGCDSTFVETLNNSGGPTGEIVSTTDLVCNAICNGIGSVDSVIGGTPPFTFLWNPSLINNDTATNLCADSYTVTITDFNTCIHFTNPIVINQPSPIVPNEVITNAACSTVCNGTITVSPTGGTGAVYTYAWAPGNPAGQGTASITSLCPGSYTLTITDLNLCTQVDTFVIGQDSPLNVSISSTNSTCSSYCNGMSYVTISAGTSPYAIQWDDILGQVNDTATSLCAGIYSALIVDALGCNTTVTDTITNAVPISANAAITDATCGSCDGQVLVSPTGGTGPYTYVWSNVSTTFDIDSNLCAGLYTVDITDNVGCVVNVNIPISNIGGPDSSTIASTNASCFGVCDGAVTGIVPFGGTPPYTYLWIQNGATTATQNNLCAGVYYVQIKDSLGCSLIDSVTITEPSQILANQQITAATCGVCNGSIIIDPSGGVGPYTPVWNIPVVPPLDTLTNLCAGIYTVVITDANGCGQNIVIPVNNFIGPILSITSTDVICNDSCNGTATVTVLSGVFPYAYSWNDALGQSTPTADSLCPGTYFVQVTGADLCVSITSATITEPTPIGFSAANLNDPLCNADTNGTISIFPSGGVLAYTYSWALSSSTTNTAANLGANTYITTVTDANGCIATQSNTLTDPPVLTISNVATDPSCNTIADGAIDITVGGGTPAYAYQWSGSSSAITEDLTSVLMGTYSITVTDANGCTISDTITLTPTTIVIADAGNDTTFCLLNSVVLNATGSTNATNYNWYMIPSNSLVGSDSIITISPSDTTSYYVVIDNGLGCADNDTMNVISYPLPVANAGADIIILSGGGTTIGGNPTGPAGSTYLWIPLPGLDNSTIANPAASPASTTSYTVMVTSAQGCVSSDSVLVSILPNISFGNGISPNGDGVNDEWEIDFIEMFPENTVEVYNRWGELLFQSKGYTEKWDGTYKGQPLPVGTYYYIINLNDPLFPDAYTGPITIMR